MKKSQIIFAASIGLLLTACAGKNVSPGDEKKVAANKSDMVCTKAATVGTHFKKKRCVTKQQAEREREDTQELLLKGTAQGGILPNKN